MKRRTALAVIALFLFGAVVGCGGGGGGGGGGSGVTISISPTATTLGRGGVQPFFARVTGTTNTVVTWSVQEAGGGTIAGNGVYTAPNAAGTYHVRCASVADPSKVATATVTVSDSTGFTVEISPATASVTTGGQQTFSARVNGATNQAVSWSVQEAGGGSITADGTYTAPNNTGTFHVVATSQADPSKSATAEVTVTDQPVVSVSISPATASVTTGGKQTFSATVTGTTNTDVTWSVQEANGGTITQGGTYTAPNIEGTFHVIATSVADPTKSAKATVTVVQASVVSVAISPTSVVMPLNGTQTFTATVTGTTNTAVTWSATGGTITSAGVYTPSATGIFEVTATSVADPTKSARATVDVRDSGSGTIIIR